MSKRQPDLLFEDIVEAIEKIQRYTKGLKFQQFVRDHKTMDAVVRNFSIMGEAANQLPQTVKKKYAHIPWRQVIGLRHRIIHEYFGVDSMILWEIIHTELDGLRQKISAIVNQTKTKK